MASGKWYRSMGHQAPEPPTPRNVWAAEEDTEAEWISGRTLIARAKVNMSMIVGSREDATFLLFCARRPDDHSVFSVQVVVDDRRTVAPWRTEYYPGRS